MERKIGSKEAAAPMKNPIQDFAKIPLSVHDARMIAAEKARALSHNGTGTRAGAIIIKPFENWIMSRGSNVLPYGMKMTPGLQEYIDDKTNNFYYSALNHAEQDAIFRAVKHFGSDALLDAAMYTRLTPCSMCARAIIEHGIKYVIDSKLPNLEDSRWGKSWYEALLMFDMADVKYLMLPDPGVFENKITREYLWNFQVEFLGEDLESRLGWLSALGDSGMPYSKIQLEQLFQKLKDIKVR